MKEELDELRDKCAKLEVKYEDLKIGYDQRVKMGDQELHTRV